MILAHNARFRLPSHVASQRIWLWSWKQLWRMQAWPAEETSSSTGLLMIVYPAPSYARVWATHSKFGVFRRHAVAAVCVYVMIVWYFQCSILGNFTLSSLVTGYEFLLMRGSKLCDVCTSTVFLRHGLPSDSWRYTNLDSNGMAHNIDFHGVTGPGGGGPALLAETGQTKAGVFKMLVPGVFVYHCAAAPLPMHGRPYCD